MTNQLNSGQLPASFRDPSGFLFSRGRVLYRQVNKAYEREYARLMESGLYEKLVKVGLLIPHVELETSLTESESAGATAHKVIQPEHVAFISYPYEWSFSQLKDAALATLSIQKRAPGLPTQWPGLDWSGPVKVATDSRTFHFSAGDDFVRQLQGRHRMRPHTNLFHPQRD